MVIFAPLSPTSPGKKWQTYFLKFKHHKHYNRVIKNSINSGNNDNTQKALIIKEYGNNVTICAYPFPSMSPIVIILGYPPPSPPFWMTQKCIYRDVVRPIDGNLSKYEFLHYENPVTHFLMSLVSPSVIICI